MSQNIPQVVSNNVRQRQLLGKRWSYDCQVGFLTHIFPKSLMLIPHKAVTIHWQMTMWVNK